MSKANGCKINWCSCLKKHAIPSIIIIATIGLFAWALCIFYAIGCKYPLESRKIQQPVYIYKTAVPDSVSTKVKDYLSLADLEMRLTKIEAEENRFIDELREETNNQINLVSGWITIWLGFIALLGIFLPMVYQFKLRRIDEQKIKDEIIRIRSYWREQLNEIKKERDDLKNEVEIYKEKLHLQKLQNLVANLSSIVDSRIIIEDVGDKTLMSDIYSKSINSFEKIVEKVFSGTFTDEGRFVIMRSLIAMYDLVNKRYLLDCPNGYSREAKNIRDTIAKLLKDISKNSIEANELKQSVQALVSRLYRLNDK
jgi:hypothetical protein